MPQTEGILTGDPSGFSAVTDASTFLYGDGTLVTGLAEVIDILPAVLGATSFEILDFDINTMFKPIDLATIVIVGSVSFDILDLEHGGITRVVDSVQTSVYRRNPSLPRGWETIVEQFSYRTALLGDVEPGESICL